MGRIEAEKRLTKDALFTEDLYLLCDSLYAAGETRRCCSVLGQHLTLVDNSLKLQLLYAQALIANGEETSLLLETLDEYDDFEPQTADEKYYSGCFKLLKAQVLEGSERREH